MREPDGRPLGASPLGFGPGLCAALVEVAHVGASPARIQLPTELNYTILFIDNFFATLFSLYFHRKAQL